jgi:hypothetical protein
MFLSRYHGIAKIEELFSFWGYNHKNFLFVIVFGLIPTKTFYNIKTQKMEPQFVLFFVNEQNDVLSFFSKEHIRLIRQ